MGRAECKAKSKDAACIAIIPPSDPMFGVHLASFLLVSSCGQGRKRGEIQGAEDDECSCRLHQLAAKRGLEVDWVQGMQGQDNSNSSGDGATETAISLSRWRADGGTAQSAMSKARALSSAGREHKQQQVSSLLLTQLRDSLC